MEIAPKPRQTHNRLLLRAALASMPYGFSVWDDDLRLVTWNQRYLELYEFAPARIREGMSLRDVIALRALHAADPYAATEELYASYRPRFRADDAISRFERDVGGRILRSTHTRMRSLGWVVTHQDVTGEVEMQRTAAAREAALATQNLRFDAAINNMPQGLCLFGPDQRLVICNETFVELYDLPAELARPGVHLRALFDYRAAHGMIPDGERAETFIKRRLKIASEPSRTVRFIERERGRIISVIQQPVADGGWVSIHQDITEQRRKEDLIQARTLELEVQNIRFDAAVNNMLHGLCMFDAENRLIVCNRQYAELYGLPEALTRPGTSFWDMLADGAKTGMVSIADPAERYRALSARIDAGVCFKQNVEMQNGRVVAVLHQPMPDGGWLSTHEDVTEQHQREEKIRHLARHDALTDLPNRVLFREEMARVEGRITRKEIVALLLIDLDHFKPVNDTLGHAVGDQVLVKVAQRLRAAARETDVIARLGGDEFAVLIGPLDSPEHAANIAERMVRTLGRPMVVEHHRVTIGASVGIAMAPADADDAETLLKHADLALYRAKSEGRGTFHFFERGMDDAMRQRRQLEASLRQGLTQQQFRLVYQPSVGLADNRIRSLEALLRWNDPERGLVAPAEFLAVAEQSGLIVQIGEWVLTEACRAALRWPDGVRVAVNLSGPQFRDRGIVGAVERALLESGLDAARLELEIREQVLLANPEAALGTLLSLRAMGVRTVIDDFGAAQSSLRFLAGFAFDKLKIDRTLLTEGGAGDPLALVGAMIGFGRSLGMATAVEGIETEAQLEAVRQAGAEEGQGYLFSLPLPSAGVDALLGALRSSRRHAEAAPAAAGLR